MFAIPPSHSQQDLHVTPPSTSPTSPSSDMSLPVSPPSRDTYTLSSPSRKSSSSQPTILHRPFHGGPSKRPKLSLNTISVQPMFGPRATSLRLETLSATSPTARNTFSNAHHRHPSDGAPLASISDQDEYLTTPRSATPAADLQSAAPSLSLSSSGSDSSVATLDSAPCASPPAHMPSDHITASGNGNDSSDGATSNSFVDTSPPANRFPRRHLCHHYPNRTSSLPVVPTKRVCFRAPLEEEIHNTKYTWKHSDLVSSISTMSTLELPSPEVETEPWMEGAKTEGEWFKEMQNRRLDDRTDSFFEASRPDGVELKRSQCLPERATDGGDESEWRKRKGQWEKESSGEGRPLRRSSCPATPIAGRAKKEREWVWTLGPLPSTTSVDADVETGG